MLERKSERIESLSADGTVESSLYDLSKTGMSCYHTLPKDTESFVMVKINDLQLRAKVVYCRKRDHDFRLGLQFWNVVPERQMKLNELVEKYSKGVPVQCAIIDDTNQGFIQETKKIIIQNSVKRKKI